MLTRKCDYALRIIRAASHAENFRITVSDIAAEEDIPYSFARTILNDLVRGGIIAATRGARGGLMLACETDKVTVLDVIHLVQGPVSLSPCVLDPSTCGKSGECAYHAVWRGADELLNDYLSGITLADVLSECR